MTVRTASAAQAAVALKQLPTGLVTVNSTFSMGAGQSISAGDVIQMVKVAAGQQAVFVGLRSTYVQAVVTVGDGLSDARYIGAQSTSAAHAASSFTPMVPMTGAPYTYSADDTIDIAISLVSVTSIAGAFYLTVILSNDPFAVS